MKTMLKKRKVNILLVFALILVSVNTNIMKTSAAVKPKIKRVSLVSSITTSVSWEKMSRASKYEVYCSKDNGKFKKVKTVEGTSCSFKKLDLGTKYTYKIKAVVNGNKSAFSKAKSVTTKEWAYLLDVAKPYKTPYEFETKPFLVGNERLSHGFTYYNMGDQSAYFNLKGKYSKISFSVGAASKIYVDDNDPLALIKFYGDDSELDETVYIKPFDLKKDYSVDINYCNKFQMFFGLAGDTSGGTFGIGNIKVYK